MAFALSHFALRADGAPCPTTRGRLHRPRRRRLRDASLHRQVQRRPSRRGARLHPVLRQGPLHRGLTRIGTAPGPWSIVSSRSSTWSRASEAGSSAARYGAAWCTSPPAWITSSSSFFLLALLLPAVLRHERSGWRPVPRFREAALEVVKIVTAFTVAHSLTLRVAVLSVVRLPARVVEPAIAASILVAALQNLVRPAGHGRWKLAFALGLLHGFGFSAGSSTSAFGGAPDHPVRLQRRGRAGAARRGRVVPVGDLPPADLAALPRGRAPTGVRRHRDCRERLVRATRPAIDYSPKADASGSAVVRPSRACSLPCTRSGLTTAFPAFAQPGTRTKDARSQGPANLIQRGRALFDDQQYEESIQTLSGRARPPEQHQGAEGRDLPAPRAQLHHAEPQGRGRERRSRPALARSPTTRCRRASRRASATSSPRRSRSGRPKGARASSRRPLAPPCRSR